MERVRSASVETISSNLKFESPHGCDSPIQVIRLDGCRLVHRRSTCKRKLTDVFFFARRRFRFPTDFRNGNAGDCRCVHVIVRNTITGIRSMRNQSVKSSPQLSPLFFCNQNEIDLFAMDVSRGESYVLSSGCNRIDCTPFG